MFAKTIICPSKKNGKYHVADYRQEKPKDKELDMFLEYLQEPIAWNKYCRNPVVYFNESIMIGE